MGIPSPSQVPPNGTGSPGPHGPPVVRGFTLRVYSAGGSYEAAAMSLKDRDHLPQGELIPDVGQSAKFIPDA
jgi:hypothetical protein